MRRVLKCETQIDSPAMLKHLQLHHAKEVVNTVGDIENKGKTCSLMLSLISLRPVSERTKIRNVLGVSRTISRMRCNQCQNALDSR